MLGWPQEAGFAFSSKNIQPLTSLDVLYSNSWSPSLLQAAASLFLSTELSPEQTQPGSSACPETLLLLWQNFPPSGMQFNPAAGKAHTVVAPGLSCYRIPPWLPVLPGGTPALQRMDRAAHSIPTAPGALEELTTASRKLSWELKGYTTGSSAQVQTVSSFLFSKKEGTTPHTQHSHLGITHIWQQHREVQQLSAQQRLHYFSIMPLMSHCPASQQRRGMEASKLLLKFLNGETNLAFVS